VSKRGLGAGVFVLLIIGLVGLYRVTHQPRLEGIHDVDVLQMVASGMCFGVALAMAIATFRGR